MLGQNNHSNNNNNRKLKQIDYYNMCMELYSKIFEREPSNYFLDNQNQDLLKVGSSSSSSQPSNLLLSLPNQSVSLSSSPSSGLNADMDLLLGPVVPASENGLVLGTTGVIFPEELIELVLSYCDPKDFTSISKVCMLWGYLVRQSSFWKLVFRKHKLESEYCKIPVHVHDHPDAWKVFTALVIHRFLNTNLVTNPSGNAGFSNWTFMSGDVDGWTIESEQDCIEKGIPRISDEEAEGGTDFCFASGEVGCSKEQNIDLWAKGFTPTVMRACVPFCIKWCDLVATPTEKSGFYEARVTLLDRDHGQISPYTPYEFSVKQVLPPGTQWRKIYHKFVVDSKNAFEVIEELRYLFLFHGAQECRSRTPGQWGPRIANTSVRIELLEPGTGLGSGST